MHNWYKLGWFRNANGYSGERLRTKTENVCTFRRNIRTYILVRLSWRIQNSGIRHNEHRTGRSPHAHTSPIWRRRKMYFSFCHYFNKLIWKTRSNTNKYEYLCIWLLLYNAYGMSVSFGLRVIVTVFFLAIRPIDTKYFVWIRFEFRYVFMLCLTGPAVTFWIVRGPKTMYQIFMHLLWVKISK